MNILYNYIPENEFERLKGYYDLGLFSILDNSNILENINYLEENNIQNIASILYEYLDLFILDNKIFKSKFERLKSKYKDNFISLLNKRIDIIEEVF